MGFSKLWNKLKKSVSRKRRLLALGVWLLLAGAAIAAVWSGRMEQRDAMEDATEAVEVSGQAPAEDGGRNPDPGQQAVVDMLKKHPQNREVSVKTIYVCGEEMKRLGVKSSEQILRMYGEHPGWTIGMNPDGSVVFSESVDDLSPQCKQNAHFGIDKEGNLTLFDGMPGKANAIRTFFQLNIDYLESSLPQEAVHQLYEGIRVTDLAEYNSVLSTFSDYAVEETEKVMKPAK